MFTALSKAHHRQLVEARRHLGCDEAEAALLEIIDGGGRRFSLLDGDTFPGLHLFVGDRARVEMIEQGKHPDARNALHSSLFSQCVPN